MKLKDFIASLRKQANGNEDIEVCIDNADITDISCMEAYWDGRLQVFERDEKGRIIGAKYVKEGLKIKIQAENISTYLLFQSEVDPNFKIDYSGLNERDIEATKNKHQQINDYVTKVKVELDFKIFYEWAKKKVESMNLDSSEEDLRHMAQVFFELQILPLNYKEKIGSIPMGHSINSFYTLWFENNFDVILENGLFHFTNK